MSAWQGPQRDRRRTMEAEGVRLVVWAYGADGDWWWEVMLHARDATRRVATGGPFATMADAEAAADRWLVSLRAALTAGGVE